MLMWRLFTATGRGGSMATLHPLDLRHPMLDPLHGLIKLTEEERRIVDHRLFQRMRSIRQNGHLHLVFPGAVHTRFIHSIGALHVADTILRALCENAVTDREKGVVVVEGARPWQAVPPPSGDLLKELFRITRIALLVHDLGHGPGSHGFDPFAPRVGQIKRLLGGDPRLSALRPLEAELCSYDSKTDDDQAISHESMSCLLFAKICADIWPNSQDELVTVVAAALLGVDVELSGHLKRLRPWLPVIQGIASSAPIDADRMDYMVRDSRACGVTYGIFDPHRILKTAICYRNDDDRYSLGWKISGLRAIENFVQARFQLYAQIYHHKTNQAFTLMLGEIGEHAKRAGLSLFYRDDDLDALCARYLEISDDARFLALLCRASEEDLGPPTRAGVLAKIRALAGRIRDRDPWTRIFESTPEWSAQAAAGLLRAGKLDAHVHPDKRRVKATKGLEKGALLLSREDGIYTAQGRDTPERSWIEASAVLRALHEEQELDRLYYTGDKAGGRTPRSSTRSKCC
jgi:HD superfamily phosphohydrolase